MDETDRKIAEILQENGRVPNNEIAARLSISEGTVRNRVRKLLEHKVLQVKGLLNPREIKERQIVYLGINTSPSKELKRSAERIAELPSVLSVSIVSGRYDIIAETYIEAYKLIDFISVELGKIESITSTESFMCLDSINKWV